MLIVISPAKSLDFESALPPLSVSQPDFLDQSAILIEILRKKSPAEIAGLMDISEALAELNVTRYAEWNVPFRADNARPALLSFNGDVYGGLAAAQFDTQQMAFAQQHLRILSGLYGLLRPLDLMQAYRLEMGTRLKNPAGKDLYAFWGEAITLALNAQLGALAENGEAAVLVNLASEEYFRAIRQKTLAARVVTPVFEERKGPIYKQISLYAKRARGLMSRYAVTHAIREVERLKAFDQEGYVFAATASDEDRWVFRRDSVGKQS